MVFLGDFIVLIATAPLAESPSVLRFTQQSLSIPRFAASGWSLDSLVQNTAWRTDQYWISERAKHRRYSFRMLRYWYMERLLNIKREQLGRPLTVLEIGVDRGQMKTFIDGVPRSRGAERLYSTWDAADVKPQQEALNKAGYAHCHQANLDDGDSLAQLIEPLRNQYDVIILLHVLEHLTKPERAIMFLTAALKSNGIILGGFPVLPSGIARLRERQLQNTAQPFGHISAFSPRRVRKMAERSGLRVDYASGAFALRASGSPLEHTSIWLRFNVAFGALFPGWPGEIYWQLRKPVADNDPRQ